MRDERILIVDDEIEIVDLVSSSLEHEFYVTGISDPGAVLDACKAENFALAILDINLGSVTGYDLCEQIRAMSPETTVVFLSSLNGEQDIVRAYEVGGFDFISKPFRPKELQEKICRLLSVSRELTHIKESSAASQKVAMDAMSLASRYGMIVAFLDNTVETDNIPELMESLNETCHGLNLQYTILCFGDDGQQLYSNASPIEEKFINVVRDQGRIIDHHQRTVFSAPFVSILIKNMPIHDPTDYGILKDIFAPLVTGASSRVKSIMLQNALSNARDQIINASEMMDDALSKQSTQLNTLISDYMTDVQSTLMILEMTEEQEMYMLSQVDEHMKSIVSLVSDQSITKSNLTGIISQISNML